jgi:hypothetical protein
MHINRETQGAQAWMLQDLALVPDYAAAIVYRQAPWGLVADVAGSHRSPVKWAILYS